MTDYAIKENNTIVNVIIADSKEIAEAVSRLEAIEVTPELPLGIGWEFINGSWVAPAYEETVYPEVINENGDVI